jgi:hypothetical protein
MSYVKCVCRQTISNADFNTRTHTHRLFTPRALSQALLVLPKTLAVNAAKDATELVAKLRAFHHSAQVGAPRYMRSGRRGRRCPRPAGVAAGRVPCGRGGFAFTRAHTLAPWRARSRFGAPLYQVRSLPAFL